MVTTKNVVHAALYLVVVLAGVGRAVHPPGGRVRAVTQVLVYIGAIVVLFLFGIMLTRARSGATDDLDNAQQLVVGAVVGAGPARRAGLRRCIDALRRRHSCRPTPPARRRTARQVSDSIFSTYLVPFEVVSVLLLAALVGAIVLARRD